MAPLGRLPVSSRIRRGSEPGDGQRLAVSSAEGVFWRGSAQSDWQPADPGLPKDEVSAMAMDSGRLFVALRTQGLWMSDNLPVAVRPQAAGSPLLNAFAAGPDPLVAACGYGPGPGVRGKQVVTGDPGIEARVLGARRRFLSAGDQGRGSIWRCKDFPGSSSLRA